MCAVEFCFFQRKGKLRGAHTMPSTYQNMLVTLLLEYDKKKRAGEETETVFEYWRRVFKFKTEIIVKDI